MGIIRDIVRHPELDIGLTVVERDPEESCDPWRFVGIDVDSLDRLTPVELRKLGKWLIDEGRRIGREYKSNGAPKFDAFKKD